MGCDTWWTAWQPEVQEQQKCTDFLVSLVKKWNWEYHLYDGQIKGEFYCLETKKVISNPYFYGIDIYGVSFVFNESNHLVTISKPKEDESYQGIIRHGGRTRVIQDGYNLFPLLFFLKNTYLPTLVVSDDYYCYKITEAHMKDIGWYEQVIEDREIAILNHIKPFLSLENSYEYSTPININNWIKLAEEMGDEYASVYHAYIPENEEWWYGELENLKNKYPNIILENSHSAVKN